MANQQLKIIVAHSLAIIHKQGGYVAPSRSTEQNTPLLVTMELDKKKAAPLDFAYVQLAEEVIEFFRDLHSHPDYKSIKERSDGPEFEACYTAAQNDEVSTLTFPYAVLMPHLYGKLKPRKPKVIDPDALEVKLIEPGQFMGTLKVPGKFFVKLVYVGRADLSKGTTFKVTDRSGNIGFFQDRADKYEGKIFLNDCFYMIAEPERHTPSNGEKHTTFRHPEILADTIIPGRGTPDPSNDESVGRKFTKGAI